MTNLRDELFHALVSGAVKESDGAAWQYNAVEAAAILEGLMPTIDRALAAGRAVLNTRWIEWCKRNLPQKPGGYTEKWPEFDHSALDEMLTQARREQQEKDAQIVDTLAEPVHFRPMTFDEVALAVSAAIRAQED